jgi:catechol O-methyltransferase
LLVQPLFNYIQPCENCLYFPNHQNATKSRFRTSIPSLPFIINVCNYLQVIFTNLAKKFNDGREQALHDYIFSLPRSDLENNPDAILSAISEFTTTKHMMTFNAHKIALSKTILDTMSPKPKTLVELGCYVGCSAIAWGAMLKGYGATDAKVYTCELEPNFAKITRDFIDLAGLNGIVEVVEGKSSESIQRLADEGKLVKGGLDVLFLDHWEAFYQPDLMLCEDLGLFRKGSMILADNTDMPGAPDYLEYVRKGGRGGEGGVKLETKTYLAETEGRKPVSFLNPSLLERDPSVSDLS